MPVKSVDKTQELTTEMSNNIVQAMNAWNKANPNKAFNTATNWSSVGNELFEKFLHNYLFPKINETSLIEFKLPDKFDPWTVDTELIAQFSEEYTYTDIVPSLTRLDDDEILNLRRNFPKMRTKLYGQGNKFKYKYTLNDNDNRLSWLTMGDAIKANAGIYLNAINGFNMFNEKSKKALAVDYALKQMKDTVKVSSMDELVNVIALKMLNFQDKSTMSNEADHASGDLLTEKTSASNLEDLIVITTDETKLYFLNSVIANTFQVAGLDPTRHIMSFRDLGGSWETTSDVTITNPNTIAKFAAMGYWDVPNGQGLLVPKGSVLTWDVSKLAEFSGNVVELKPISEFTAMVYDVNALRFRRNTKNMYAQGLQLQETEDYNHYLRMYVNNNISTFFNKCFIYSDDADVANNAYKL